MRILRAADYRVMPWKNGGGTTTEIAVSPEGAGLDAFDWRMSMARVETDGPFSSFPGIDRTLSVLEGEGIAIDVEGHAAARLTQETMPFAFPADAATHAELIGGPITDLNVMTRRARLEHTVLRLALAEPLDIVPGGKTTLVLCHCGALSIEGGREERLAPLDCAWIGAEEGAVRLVPSPSAAVFVVRIYPAEQNR